MRDLARGRTGWLVWGPPLAVVVLTALLPMPSVARGATWALALGYAGAACLFNAWRSGRAHCHVTGPFFIAMAALSWLHGSAWLPLGSQGWLVLGAILAVGSPLLIVIPDRIWRGGGDEACGCGPTETN